MGFPLTLWSHQCLLGLFSAFEEDKYLNVFLQESLFLARMQIAKTWIKESPPNIQQWIRAVNVTLIYKKVLYLHRCCPNKYYKIWDRWLKDASTCTVEEWVYCVHLSPYSLFKKGSLVPFPGLGVRRPAPVDVDVGAGVYRFANMSVHAGYWLKLVCVLAYVHEHAQERALAVLVSWHRALYCHIASSVST